MATNKTTITNVTLGNSGFSSSTTLVNTLSSFPSGWLRQNELIFTGTCYLLLGYSGSTAYTTIYRCTDLVNFATWTPITVPAGAWLYGAVSATGTIVLAATSSGPSTITCYSTTDGLTWNTGSTFTSSQLYAISYGNKFIIAFTNSLSTGKQSTDGITWTNVTLLPYGSWPQSLVYSTTINRWFIASTSGNLFRSDDSTGSSWTNIGSVVGANTSGVYVDDISVMPTGQIVFQVRNTNIRSSLTLYTSSDGYVFNQIFYSTSYYLWLFHASAVPISADTLLIYSIDSTKLFYIRQDSLYTDNHSLSSGTMYFPNNVSTNNRLIVTTPILFDRSGNTIRKVNFNLDNVSSVKYVDVTATNGNLTLTKRLPITFINANSDIYTLQVNPSSIFLTGYDNGFVDPASYINATTELSVLRNGVIQSGWTFAASSISGAVANSISGSTLSVTAMTQAASNEKLNITATSSDTTLPDLLSSVQVVKGVSSGWSGLASSFTKFSTSTNTYIALKFLPNGYFQIKYGSGGSYANVGMWYSPIDTTNARGAGYYIILNYTGATLTTGTGGVLGGGAWTTWNQMNTSREYILSDATTGTHTCNIELALATSSAGANAVIGTGALELVVP